VDVEEFPLSGVEAEQEVLGAMVGWIKMKLSVSLA